MWWLPGLPVWWLPGLRLRGLCGLRCLLPVVGHLPPLLSHGARCGVGNGRFPWPGSAIDPGQLLFAARNALMPQKTSRGVGNIVATKTKSASARTGYRPVPV